MQMFIVPLLYLIAFANIFLAWVVFSQGIKNKINLWFGLMSIGVVFWCIAIANFYSELEYLKIINWTKITHFAGLFISLVFMYFTFYFPRSDSMNKIILFITASLFAVISSLIFFSDTVIKDVQQGVYEQGSLYGLYGVSLSINFIIAFRVLILKFIKEKNILIRGQIKYILIGGIASSFLATIFDLLLPILGNYNYLWLGPVATISLIGSTYLAVQKYKLFNIKLIAVELFSASIAILLAVRFVGAGNLPAQMLNGILLIIALSFGVMLTRSTIKDIEKRERLEVLIKRLKKANGELELLDIQKSEFISIASHQLRTPLTAIKGYASLLIEGSFGKLSKEAKDPLNKIFQSSQKLVLLVQNYLMISKIEQGEIEYASEEFDLLEAVTAATQEITPTVKTAGLDLRVDVDRRKTYKINADYTKIKQALLNTISFCITNTSKGFIELTMLKEGNTISITVSDTGYGLSKDAQGSLFKKSTDYDLRESVQGNSLYEMYLTREIVNAYDGEMWVRSEGENKGVTFFIEFKHTGVIK